MGWRLDNLFLCRAAAPVGAWLLGLLVVTLAAGQDAVTHVRILPPTPIATPPIRAVQPTAPSTVLNRQASYLEPVVPQEDPFGEGQMKQISSQIKPGRPLSAFRRPGSEDRYAPSPYQPVKSKLIFPQEDPFGEKQPPPGAEPPVVRPAGEPGKASLTDPSGNLPRPPAAEQEKLPAGGQPEPTLTDPGQPAPTAADPVQAPGSPGNAGAPQAQPPSPVISQEAGPGPTVKESPPAASPGSGQANPQAVDPTSLLPEPADASISYDKTPPQMELPVSRPPTSSTYRRPAPQPIANVEPAPSPAGAAQPVLDPQPIPFFVPAYEPIPGLPELGPAPGPPGRRPSLGPGSLPYRPASPVLETEWPPVVRQGSELCDLHCQGCRSCRPGFSQRGAIGPRARQEDVQESPVCDPQWAAENCCDVCPEYYFAFQGATNDLSTLFDGAGDSLQVDHGSAFAFALGKLHGQHWRSELELAIRNNDIDDMILAGRSQGMRGDISAFSGMTNVYWEATNFPVAAVVPYAGAGVGFASLEATLTGAGGAPVLAPGGGRDSSFAYQWMAGISLRPNDQFDLFAEYRFFEADSLRLDAVPAGVSGNYDYQSNTLGVGFRWKF